MYINAVCISNITHVFLTVHGVLSKIWIFWKVKTWSSRTYMFTWVSETVHWLVRTLTVAFAEPFIGKKLTMVNVCGIITTEDNYNQCAVCWYTLVKRQIITHHLFIFLAFPIPQLSTIKTAFGTRGPWATSLTWENSSN